MDYLQTLFNQELADEGEVNIRGVSFSRDRILSELDPTAYQNIFDEWKEERRQNMLERAKQIMMIADNKDRLFSLQRVYQKGKLLPFIGAGLSIPSDFPSWTGFLWHVQKHSGVKTEELERLIQEGKFEESAQLLHDTDSGHLQEKLENCFGKELTIDEIQGIIRRLPDFFPDTVITTNFDDLLKTIYNDQEKNFSEILYGMDAVEFGSLSAKGIRVLLKIHGSYTSLSKRILTTADYDRHYSQNNSIRSCIETLFSSTVLFLGCSLAADRILYCMEDIAQSQSQPVRHYAFLCCAEMNEESMIERRRFLQKASIYPIWYDGDHDEDIEALLEFLNAPL